MTATCVNTHDWPVANPVNPDALARVLAQFDRWHPHRRPTARRAEPARRPTHGGLPMKLHPRYAIAKAAELQIGEAIRDAITEHDITYAELLVILAEQQRKWATYLLRIERHPDDPERKADEE